MGLWATWLDLLGSVVTTLAADGGLGLGLAIVAATLLVRGLVLPLAWPVAYRACIRQKKLAKLQPELQRLRDEFRSRPELYLQKLTALYEANGLAMFEGRGLFTAAAQMPLFLGMFQVLRTAGDGVRFLWIPNLLRPDVALAVITGLATALMMAMNPDLPEHIRFFMIVVPSILAVVAALQFSSALAIYWATSNIFSAMQTVVLHAIVRRRIAAGRVRI